MKKTFITIILAVCSMVMAMAQEAAAVYSEAVPVAISAQQDQPQAEVKKRVITGTLLDKESQEAVMQATIQLLKAEDSTYVAGAVTDMDGNFSLQAPKNGKYIIKMTNIGYKQVVRNVEITDDKDFAFGKVTLETDAVLLKEVVANGVAAKVVVKEDTFIYNAAAYRTPEGSVIEELVKRLPGAKVDDDGKITINGKEVKKIKVDGKEFMTGDTQTALKNLPTAIIEKVKAYDEKSDLARMTGIDDGEETTTLDFGIKRGMNKGYLGNIDLAAGTHERYSGRVMGAVMKDNYRLMAFGNMNNTSDRGFSSFGRGGGNGLQTSKMAGLNFNYEEKDKLRADFSVRWNHNNTDTKSVSSSENFISRVGAFNNSVSNSYSRSNSWNFTGRLEWKPDTLTTIAVRPNFTTSKSDSRSMNASASFNDDPYKYSDNPLDSLMMLEVNRNLFLATEGTDSLLINRRDNNSLSYSTNTNFNIQATISRRLSRNGRNLTLQGRYGSSNGDSESISTQYVRLFRPYLKGADVMSDADSIYYRNRYNVTPSKNWNYQVSATYSEPIYINKETKNSNFLQFRYQYQFRNTVNDRQTHDFSKYPTFGQGVTPMYRDFRSYLAPFVNEQHQLSEYLDEEQSRYTEYNNYIHEMELTLRRTTSNYNLNIGVMMQPQSSRLTYRYLGLDTVARRTVNNITPTLDFRYRWTRQKSIRLNYRGNTSQPSMTDLLPTTDDTDPLNIRKGNPGLKPSFTQSFRLTYNNYVQKYMRAIMAFANFSTTRNSVSSMTKYNDANGGRVTQPMNINGNWSVNGAFMFNTAIDSTGVWTVNSMTNLSYNNRVSYITLAKTDAFGNNMYRLQDGRIAALNRQSYIVGEDGQPTAEKVRGTTVRLYDDPTKNFLRTTSISERLGFSYRKDWFEIEVNGNVRYDISKSELQPERNMDTWDFDYGTDITVNLPWNMSISTGAHMNSRRGYSSETMNTDEFIWNAQIAQTFLKKKNLTLTLQYFDILNQRSSFSRSLNASSRSDTWYNSVNSYGMLHVIYRFNAFGGKQARQGGQRGQRGDMPPGPPPGGMDGGPRGNFGGGGFGGGGFGGRGRF